ncbi:hypothetical protein ACSBR2_011293 [Camellia fascicularis]
MAESAVIHLLANFAPFLQQEANLLTGVREEIQYIRDEFDRMTAFLRVADAMEENNPELKVWVKQVREAAYDIGDVLELYMLRLGHRHGAGFRGFLGKVSCFIKTLKARHQIASEVQRMKSRVIDISKGHQRYHDRYGMLEQGSSSRSTGLNTACHDYRGDALLLHESELVGIDKPKSQLIRWLVNEDPRLKVFSVSGMGGLGKTTLVKKAFDDAVVKNHFQSHVWITVSESFKIEVLLKGIIKQLFEEIKQPVPQGMDNMDTNSLKGIINAFLQQKRYVFVLDDVWDIHAWQSFRYVFPIGNCGSRVVLTTRNADLASITSTEYYGDVYNLQPLPPEESWTLFCRKTFVGNSCPSQLEGLSKAILNRCEGLPLAIVAISGLLSTKDKSSVDEWDKIYRSLGAELQGNDKFQCMKKILSLSYIDLPCHLKFCFLYLSVFPEDCLIDHERLIRLWVAEGFVEMKEGMTIEEVAEGYLNELINRSLIQVAKRRRDRRVKMWPPDEEGDRLVWWLTAEEDGLPKWWLTVKGSDCRGRKACDDVKWNRQGRGKRISEMKEGSWVRGLLNLKCTKLDHDLCEWLVHKVDPKTCSLNVHGRQLLFTELDVHKVLGIPAEGKMIELKKSSQAFPKLFEELGVVQGAIKLNALSEYLTKTEEAGEEFTRILPCTN